MWSMMSRPGDSKIERAAACDCFLEIAGDDLMKLLQSVHRPIMLFHSRTYSINAYISTNSVTMTVARWK